MRPREDAASVRAQFYCTVGQPPYRRTIMRARKGLNRTAFFSTIGAHATDFKVHNSYLKPDFFTDPVSEYWAMRTSVGLFDVTGEEIIEVRGPDALALLNLTMPRDVSRLPDMHSQYGVLCHPSTGGIVEDGILARFDAEHFWWIGGPGSSEETLYLHAQGRDVTVESFNDRIHVASIQGPLARQVLQRVTDSDVAGYPVFATFRATVCGAPVVVTRTGFTGELGYEIYVDVAVGGAVFAALWDEVRAAGGALCGSKALAIRRIEAGILNFTQDFDYQHTPVEIGLGWMVSAKKGSYPLGDLLLARKATPPAARIVGFRLHADEVPLIGDPVLDGDRPAGLVTSPVASPALGCPIAIGWFDGTAPTATIVCEDRRHTADVVRLPFLDPERGLMRA